MEELITTFINSCCFDDKICNNFHLKDLKNKGIVFELKRGEYRSRAMSKMPASFSPLLLFVWTNLNRSFSKAFRGWRGEKPATSHPRDTGVARHVSYNKSLTTFLNAVGTFTLPTVWQEHPLEGGVTYRGRGENRSMKGGLFLQRNRPIFSLFFFFFFSFVSRKTLLCFHSS